MNSNCNFILIEVFLVESDLNFRFVPSYMKDFKSEIRSISIPCKIYDCSKRIPHPGG